MNRTITICDSCNKEYTKGQYGTEGVLELKRTDTNSCPERSICKMDLCSSCLSLVTNSIKRCLEKEIVFKSEGLGVWY